MKNFSLCRKIQFDNLKLVKRILCFMLCISSLSNFGYGACCPACIIPSEEWKDATITKTYGELSVQLDEITKSLNTLDDKLNSQPFNVTSYNTAFDVAGDLLIEINKFWGTLQCLAANKAGCTKNPVKVNLLWGRLWSICSRSVMRLNISASKAKAKAFKTSIVALTSLNSTLDPYLGTSSKPGPLKMETFRNTVRKVMDSENCP